MAQRESRLFVCLPLLVSVIKVFASLFHWAIVEVGKKLGEVSLQFDSSKTETGISDALSFSEISLAASVFNSLGARRFMTSFLSLQFLLFPFIVFSVTLDHITASCTTVFLCYVSLKIKVMKQLNK